MALCSQEPKQEAASRRTGRMRDREWCVRTGERGTGVQRNERLLRARLWVGLTGVTRREGSCTIPLTENTNRSNVTVTGQHSGAFVGRVVTRRGVSGPSGRRGCSRSDADADRRVYSGAPGWLGRFNVRLLISAPVTLAVRSRDPAPRRLHSRLSLSLRTLSLSNK